MMRFILTLLEIYGAAAVFIFIGSALGAVIDMLLELRTPTYEDYKAHEEHEFKKWMRKGL